MSDQERLQEAIAHCESAISICGGYQAMTPHRAIYASCLEALREKVDRENPQPLAGPVKIGQVVTGKIVAIDAERGLASIKWEPKVDSPRVPPARLTRFKGVKYLPGRIDSVDQLLEGYLYWLDRANQVAFKCPCGCGNLVLLDVSPTMRSHKWKLEEVRAGYITLEPSIHSVSTCGSHYYIRENQILWMN